MQASRQIADDSRAFKKRQLAANEGSASDAVSSFQPGSAENATAESATVEVSAGGAGTRTVAQAATSAQSAATQECIAMAWILLEALVALILAVFIVWFTMGGRASRRAPRNAPRHRRTNQARTVASGDRLVAHERLWLPTAERVG